MFGEMNGVQLAAKSVGYLGLILLVGAGVFDGALPLRPAPAPARSMLRIGLLLGFVLVAVGSVADITCACISMLGQVGLADVVGFIRHTHQGRAIEWRLGLGLLLVLGLWPNRERWSRPAVLLVSATSLGLLATFTTVSHAASTRAWLPQAVDVTHLVAVVTWPALLIYFSLLRSDSTRLAMLPRLSNLAFASVMVLFGTGAYGAWVHIPMLRDVWQTPYGRALALKVGVILALLAMAGVNRWRLMPRLPAPDALRSLVRLVYLEAAVIVVVLVLTALLTTRDLPSSRSIDSGALGRAPIVMPLVS